jgi:hypothetical protein
MYSDASQLYIYIYIYVKDLILTSSDVDMVTDMETRSTKEIFVDSVQAIQLANKIFSYFI